MSADVNAILALEIPLIVEIASRRMPLAETVNLAHGAIIEFPKHADSELRVLINNKAVGSGQASRSVRTSGFASPRSVMSPSGSKPWLAEAGLRIVRIPHPEIRCVTTARH